MISDDVSLILSLKDYAEDCLIELYECAEADREMSAYWRSMYARAVFDFIDGAVRGLLFQAYAGRKRSGVRFSDKEMFTLESYVDLRQRRAAVTTFSEAQMLGEIELAFVAFARVNQSDYVLPIDDPAWVFIKETALLRATLDSSMARDVLDVRPENVDALRQGMEWFVVCLIDLLKSSEEALSELTAETQADDHELIM